MIRQAVLRRRPSTPDGTLGDLEVQDVQTPLAPVVVKRFVTMERSSTGEFPDIPAGRYLAVWTRSARLSEAHGEDFFTYELLEVLKRTGIRMHSANLASQLKGCISPGLEVGEIDGKIAVFGSRKAMQQFEDLMDRKSFYLTILEAA